MKKKINVGIIGAGRISGKHIEALSNLSDIYNLFLICDEDLNKLIFGNNILQYVSIQSIPENVISQVDLFVISTPSGTHGLITKYLLKYGKRILVEKPFLLSHRDIEYFKSLSPTYKDQVFLVMQNRFNNSVIDVKKVIDKNNFGRLLLISAKLLWCRDQEYYDTSDWRGTYHLDGGVVANQASHYLDLIEYFGGSILSVNAIGATCNVDIEVEDTCLAQGSCMNGALFNFEATTSIRPKNMEGSICLIFKNGVIKIGGTSANKIEIIEGLKNSDIELSSEMHSNVYGNGHQRLYESLSDLIIYNKKNSALLNLNDAINSAITLQMVYSSIETGVTQCRNNFQNSRRLGEKN